MPYPVENVLCTSPSVSSLAQFCVSDTVRVVIPREALNSFRRKALKQFPLEMFAYLVGYVYQPGGLVKEIRVSRFIYPPQTATKGSVSVQSTEVEFQGREKLLGSIHSHPWEVEEPNLMDHACPSAWDIQSAAESGELVYCIYNIAEKGEGGRRSTHLGVFLGTPNVAVEVV
jgi:proteasome lid subunit RPN8/RPN11